MTKKIYDIKPKVRSLLKTLTARFHISSFMNLNAFEHNSELVALGICTNLTSPGIIID